MAKEMADLKLNNEERQMIMLTGGIYEIPLETQETFLDWLAFVSNPLNLKPGLPDLIIIMDSRRMDDSAIKVSFHKNKASLRSFKLELTDFSEGNPYYFRDTDPREKRSLVDGKPLHPNHLKKWVFNLFLHTELEELHLPFPNSELPDLFAMVAARANV